MKKIIIIVITLFISSSIVSAQTKGGRKDDTKNIVLHSCLRHHAVNYSDPSKCPFCGMDLHLSAKAQMKIQVTKAYSCPSNATIVSSFGKKLNLSPKEEMKMQLVKAENKMVQNCEPGMVMAN